MSAAVNTAPPEGAPPPPAETPQSYRSPREERLLAIYAAREETRAKELRYGEEAHAAARADAGLPPEEVAEPQTPPEDAERAAEAEERQVEAERARLEREPAQPAEAGAAEPVTPAGREAPAQTTPQQYHQVEVDGVTYNVTPEQLAHLARIGAITNRALGDYRQQYGQYAPQPQQQQAPQPQPQQAPPPAIPDAEAADIARRLQYGTQEDVARAVQDLANRFRANAGQPSVDPVAIANAAAQHAVNTTILRSNLEVIGREYPEIFEDRALSQLAALKLHELRQENAIMGRQMDDLAAYRESCARVRGVTGRTNGASQPQGQRSSGTGVLASAPRVAPMAAREAAKRAAPVTPSGVSRKAGAVAPEDRPLSPAEIVAQIRQGRGQPADR